MRQEEQDTLILRPGRPTGGLFGKSLTVGPYQVGIVVRDGELQPPFSEGAIRLPRGHQVETYVASTAPFNLVFWLADPGDPARPAQGISLDQPALTADGLPVTGRIELTLSVTPEHAARLLRLRIMGHHEIRASDVSNAIKGELVAKVLALQLHRYTSDELRGQPSPSPGHIRFYQNGVGLYHVQLWPPSGQLKRKLGPYAPRTVTHQRGPAQERHTRPRARGGVGGGQVEKRAGKKFRNHRTSAAAPQRDSV